MSGVSRGMLAVGLVGLLGISSLAPARAEDPSAQQIINALTPKPGTTRGIRPIAQPAPEAPAARPAAPAPVAQRAPSISLTVNFATGSTTLTPEATRTLTRLGEALSSEALKGDRFRIEGHTDTVGSPEANKALSEQRAQAVVAFLSKNFSIDASRLEAVGMGEDGLIVRTPPNTPNARNRRVQVVNLGA